MKMKSIGLGFKMPCAALGLCLVLACAAKPAAAAHVGLSVGVGVPVYSGGYGYSGGHYETRVERVLVAPERHDRHWVEPVYQTCYSRGFAETVIVRLGYWHEACLPARYEERYVQVWVPGCAVYGPPVVAGGFFGFGYRHR
jgi:hypothetical protein